MKLPLSLTELSGRKVKLRPFELMDVNAHYIAWLNDQQIMRYSNQRFHVHDQATSECYLKSFCTTDNLFIAITDKNDGKLIGTMTVYVNRHHGTADVGIMLGERNSWGLGIGQDAWNTLCTWLMGPSVGLRKLTAGAVRPNVGMLRIMERFGMQLEAVRFKQEIIEGEEVDMLYYSRFAYD
jgi:ribosomal-protein-alanine N-acetyltransferase